MWMLQRRFRPLERLIDRIEQADPVRPGRRSELRRRAPRRRSTASPSPSGGCSTAWSRSARRSGQLVMRAQEEERRRLARDLHDEVNQALTAILLRLEALAQDAPPEHAQEVARAQAPGEPGDGRASEPRPPAPPHGAGRPRPRGRDRRPAEALRRPHRRGGALRRPGRPRDARGGRADRRVPRGPGGADQRRAPRRARPRWRWSWRWPRTSPSCACATTGTGSIPAAGRADPDGPPAGLGLRGMAERARLVGGELDVRSAPGGGTSVTLRIR